MKKIVALMLVVLVAMLGIAFIGCDDEDEKECTEEDAQGCIDDYTTCTQGCGGDTTCVEGCLSDYCDCIEELGCDVGEGFEC